MANHAQSAGTSVPAIFNFQSNEVRTAVIDGEIWFVAKDLMSALDYAKSSTPGAVMAHIPDEWKGIKPIDTLGGEQSMLMLSEHGLYFFLGRSDKPKALPFQKWLAGEVLPAIRKTGRYVATPHPYRPTPRDIHSIEEIESKIEFRALQLSHVMHKKFLADMREQSQFHYFMTGDNDVETWEPSFGNESALDALKHISRLAALLAERSVDANAALRSLILEAA